MLSVVKELFNLPNRSLDVLDMDNKLLHISAPVIAPFLTHIFNLSLYHGKIPSDFKLVRVTPIFKGHCENNDLNNYRPISIVSTVSILHNEKCKFLSMGYEARMCFCDLELWQKTPIIYLIQAGMAWEGTQGQNMRPNRLSHIYIEV